MNEKKIERIFHDAQIKITLSNGQSYDGSLLDISLNGCLTKLTDNNLDIDNKNV